MVSFCVKTIITISFRGSQIFRKHKSPLNILGEKNVTWNKFNIKDPQILGDTYNFFSPWQSGTWDLYTPCVLERILGAGGMRGRGRGKPQKQIVSARRAVSLPGFELDVS